MKKKLAALTLALTLCLTALLPAAAFDDVAYNYWAAQYINRASANGWVNGTGGGKFTPEKEVTAAEFFLMAANAFFPEELAAQPKRGEWYTPAWTLAQELSLAEGTAVRNEKQLTAPLTRQDMARIVCNVLSARGLALPEDGPSFTDCAGISAGYREAISAAAGLGVLNGKGAGVFAPEATMIRAEAATVLCQMAEALYPLEVVRLVNIERAKEGLRPLRPDPVLMAAAQLRASEVRVKFDHTRPNGQPCMTAMYDVGSDPYDLIRSGENIALGYSTPEAVVNGWMNSPGHRMNILTGAFTIIGVGRDNTGWVQMFGRWDWE